MARDYDSQLLESVAVRRRRLRDALLFGSLRIRRSHEEGLGKVFGGVALAMVLGAGCVGWSFVADQRADKRNGTPSPSAPPGNGLREVAPGTGAVSPPPQFVPQFPLPQSPPNIPPTTRTSSPLGVPS
ncbi:hypothetical protein [Yinghuangia sp. YIM S09857]|uniref:hypothetical protein n=1 Tax=Yinghuangia sp. YIM S09857 TaxID=3436929 RepID=UPI003F537F05